MNKPLATSCWKRDIGYKFEFPLKEIRNFLSALIGQFKSILGSNWNGPRNTVAYIIADGAQVPQKRRRQYARLNRRDRPGFSWQYWWLFDSHSEWVKRPVSICLPFAAKKQKTSSSKFVPQYEYLQDLVLQNVGYKLYWGSRVLRDEPVTNNRLDLVI